MDQNITIRLHQKLARAVCKVLKCDWSDAEDGASHAIVLAIEHGNTTFSYLLACALNYCRNDWRRNKTYTPIPQNTDEDFDGVLNRYEMTTPSKQELGVIAAEALRYIAMLPDKQRKAIGLVAAGYSNDEAADALGVKRELFPTQVSRARESLRAHDFYEPAKMAGHHKFIGVTRHHRKWQAKIEANSKTIYIGQYGTAVEAALAYDARARQFLGPRTRLNFPVGERLAL